MKNKQNNASFGPAYLAGRPRAVYVQRYAHVRRQEPPMIERSPTTAFA